jgi:hypothetical protein
MCPTKSLDTDGPSRSPELGVYFTIAASMSNLHHWLTKRVDEVRFLRLVPRNTNDWLAIMGVWGDDGTPMVVFGSGELYTDALRGLNASIAKGAFKVDKFATGS